MDVASGSPASGEGVREAGEQHREVMWYLQACVRVGLL